MARAAAAGTADEQVVRLDVPVGLRTPTIVDACLRAVRSDPGSRVVLVVNNAALARHWHEQLAARLDGIAPVERVDGAAATVASDVVVCTAAQVRRGWKPSRTDDPTTVIVDQAEVMDATTLRAVRGLPHEHRLELATVPADPASAGPRASRNPEHVRVARAIGRMLADLPESELPSGASSSDATSTLPPRSS